MFYAWHAIFQFLFFFIFLGIEAYHHVALAERSSNPPSNPEMVYPEAAPASGLGRRHVRGEVDGAQKHREVWHALY